MRGMIDANIDEMEAYLRRLINIKNNLSTYISDLSRAFFSVSDWNDATREKTRVVIEELKKQLNLVFDVIDDISRTLDLYIEDLADYSNPSIGRFGRL